MTLAASHEKELGDKTCNLQAQNMETSTSRVFRLQLLIKAQFYLTPPSLARIFYKSCFDISERYIF